MIYDKYINMHAKKKEGTAPLITVVAKLLYEL